MRHMGAACLKLCIIYYALSISDLPLRPAMASDRFKERISIQNRKAFFDYFMVETWQAGVMLSGTEIKSIREGNINLQDAFAQFKGDELYLVNAHVKAYEGGTHWNHEPRRERKLLCKAKELKKMQKGLGEVGTTLIPTKVYINERGLCKVEVSLAKGKKNYDKRETIKDRDQKREASFE